MSYWMTMIFPFTKKTTLDIESDILHVPGMYITYVHTPKSLKQFLLLIGIGSDLPFKGYSI